MPIYLKHKLKTLCTKIGSGSTPRGGDSVYKTHGISLIRSQNILDFTFSKNGLAYIDEVQAKELANVTLKERDVLLNITGDSVARVSQVPDNILPARVNQHVAIIRANQEKLNPEYLKYCLLSKPNKELLLSLASTGATRKAITKVMIEEFEIAIPSEEGTATQTRIAAILSALDDKIELNRRTNETLEKIAETLFKKYFVEGIEEENLPEGWRMGKLGEVMEIKYGKDHKHLNSGKIPVYGSGGIMRYVDKALFEHESILIPRKGTLSNLFYVNTPFWSVDTMFYTKLKDSFYTKYLFLLLKSMDLSSMDVGSAVPSLTTELLNKIVIIIPSEGLLKHFDKTVTPLFELIDQNINESKALVITRDSLLPKLMLGEIEVDERIQIDN